MRTVLLARHLVGGFLRLVGHRIGSALRLVLRAVHGIVNGVGGNRDGVVGRFLSLFGVLGNLRGNALAGSLYLVAQLVVFLGKTPA